MYPVEMILPLRIMSAPMRLPLEFALSLTAIAIFIKYSFGSGMYSNGASTVPPYAARLTPTNGLVKYTIPEIQLADVIRAC